MPLQVTFSDKNNKYQYDGHANELPTETKKGKVGRVYVGDRDAGSMVQIRHRKIKQVVNCQSDMHGLSQEKEVKYLNIDPVDNSASCLELAYRFICTAVEKGDNVLIFCQSGSGRSAAVALYYLMKNGNGMSLADAHRLLERERGAVQCNDRSAGFRKEILEKLILEEKKLRGKKVSISVDSARIINYLDGKGSAYSGPLKTRGGDNRMHSSSNQKSSPVVSLAVFGVFIAVLYGMLLVATGGK